MLEAISVCFEAGVDDRRLQSGSLGAKARDSAKLVQGILPVLHGFVRTRVGFEADMERQFVGPRFVFGIQAVAAWCRLSPFVVEERRSIVI